MKKKIIITLVAVLTAVVLIAAGVLTFLHFYRWQPFKDLTVEDISDVFVHIVHKDTPNRAYKVDDEVEKQIVTLLCEVELPLYKKQGMTGLIGHTGPTEFIVLLKNGKSFSFQTMTTSAKENEKAVAFFKYNGDLYEVDTYDPVKELGRVFNIECYKILTVADE